HITGSIPLSAGPAFSSYLSDFPPDINTRWSNSSFVNFSKYTDGGPGALPNVVPIIQKAYSPHAFPDLNRAKNENAGPADNGIDPVMCLDCHSAHGSGFVSGYGAVLGATSGVMLNDNGGLYVTPLDGEEKLCWDCHTDAMDYYGDGLGGSSDWEGNWNATNSIVPYKAGAFVSSHFYPSKWQDIGGPGGESVTWTITGSGTTASGQPTGDRNMIYCSTCHDPHGIAPGTADMEYMVPILRGTWMTSPYKEDRAPGSVSDMAPTVWNTSWNPAAKGYSGVDIDGHYFGPVPRATNHKLRADVEAGAGYPTSLQANTSGWDGFFIDQNTFNPAVNGGYMFETDMQFAGLCLTLGCHDQGSLLSAWGGHNVVAGWSLGVSDPNALDIVDSTVGTRTAGTEGNLNAVDAGTGSEWMMQYYGDPTVVDYDVTPRMYGTRSVDLTINNYREPHISDRYAFAQNTQAGTPVLASTWKLSYADQTGGDSIQQGYHKYSCSKCHTPHASRLKRLMRTNCLDNGVPGDYNDDNAAQGVPTGSHTPASATDTYTAVVTNKNTMNPEAPNCHSVAGSKGTGVNSGWNTITPW
ncbi:hypothetical protein ACFL2A_04395, partial [Thermodesulfobacteriota bacterium]